VIGSVPATIFLKSAAFSEGAEPRMSSIVSGRMPKSSGLITLRVMEPSLTTQAWVGPHGLISSSPSSEYTTIACLPYVRTWAKSALVTASVSRACVRAIERASVPS
jgi:hypothetical protein